MRQGATGRNAKTAGFGSATFPCESVLPVRLRPDFSVVFGVYTGRAIHRLAQKSPRNALSVAEFSAPIDWTRQG
jgi:flavin reductase (DIM6/NTAB) family NADH-FMN oxidoreductase RutF